MYRKFLLILFVLMLCSAAATAETPDSLHKSRETKPWLSPMRDIYFITGIPLDRQINRESMDVKFQFSVKLYPFTVSKNWTCYIAYTQISVWNFYGKSSPFRDNSYMPGFYFDGVLPKNNRLILGIEHRSNGRPYYGNALASEENEDYSRGMNYFYGSWRKTVGRHEYGLDAKAGFSAGVGDYPRGEEFFTQDLFVYYLGYLTFDYRYNGRKFGAHACVTPIYNKSIANVTAEASYRIVRSDKFPLRLMLQFHYGFDEALCDCVKDAVPPVHLRFGLLLR